MNLIQSSSASLLVILFVMIFGCGRQMTGVETTNGATVVIRDNSIEGTTLPYSSVYMFDTGYIPYIDRGLGIVLVSDEDGQFQLNGLEEKVLNVQIFDRDKRVCALLSVGGEGVTYRSDLQHSGNLQGVVECNQSGRILVFISGTGYYILLDRQGSFYIDDLPPGSYSLQAALLAPSQNGEIPFLLSTSKTSVVSIQSGKTTALKEIVVIPTLLELF